MSPFIGVSHGEWRVPQAPDPAPGDYEAIITADLANWRMTSDTLAWSEITSSFEHRITSPSGLPDVWYTWRGASQPVPTHAFQKSVDNGGSWSDLTEPFTPTGSAGGEWVALPSQWTAVAPGTLVVGRWSSAGHPGQFWPVNVYYSTDDGGSWSAVFESDITWPGGGSLGDENLVANATYTWFAWNPGTYLVRRISHTGGVASLEEIALPGGTTEVTMLATDASLAGARAYAVIQRVGAIAILRMDDTAVTDVTPDLGIPDGDVNDIWIASAGDVVMALVSGFVASELPSSIWRSTDAGVTWEKVRDWDAALTVVGGQSGKKAVGNSPNRPNTWFVWANNHEPTGSIVLRTTDQGATWTDVSLPSADPAGDDDQVYYQVTVLG